MPKRFVNDNIRSQVYQIIMTLTLQIRRSAKATYQNPTFRIRFEKFYQN